MHTFQRVIIFAHFSHMTFSYNTEKATIDDETEVEARIISMVAGTEINYISIHSLITFTIDFGNVT